MQNRRNGRQLIILGVVLIVLVLGAAFVLTRGGGGSKTASEGNLAPEVVAVQTVPQNTVLKPGDNFGTFFAVKQVPSNLIPFGAYTSVNAIEALTKTNGCGPVQAAGCQGQVTTTQTIFQNTPVVTGMFSTLGQFRTGPGPSFTIPYGFVAIAISLAPADSELGSVSAGDDVDLIGTYTGGGKSGSPLAPTQTQYLLNDVRVISVNQPPQIASGGTANTSQAQASTGSGSIIVLARYQEALEIQHLKDAGWHLSVVLRSSKETDIPHFRTTPVTDSWFFKKVSNPFRTNPGY